MNLRDYREQISFRFVQPQTRLPRGYGEFSKLRERRGSLRTFRHPTAAGFARGFVRLARYLPDTQDVYHRHRCAHQPGGIPDARRSCLRQRRRLARITLLSGIVCNPGKTVVGIDNFSMFGGPRDAFLARFNQYRSSNHHFHEMDYRTYFQTIHQGPIGFYIYDGDHNYEHQLEGLRMRRSFPGRWFPGADRRYQPSAGTPGHARFCDREQRPRFRVFARRADHA